MTLSSNLLHGFGIFYTDAQADSSNSERFTSGSQMAAASIDYHLFAFELQTPFNLIASFKLPFNKVPIELLTSEVRENIVLVGCESSLVILLLEVKGPGEPAKLTLVKDIELDQGSLQDYCLIENFVYAKNEQNDIVEMKFPDLV